MRLQFFLVLGVLAFALILRYTRGGKEFTKAIAQVLVDLGLSQTARGEFKFCVWVAQGFGMGLIPCAPGTFGSLAGLGLFAALLALGTLWGFTVGLILCIFVSIRICGEAEAFLGQKDPSSIVIDEISAMPSCFVSSVATHVYRTGNLPSSEYFFSTQGWVHTLVVFSLFRLFDVAKPWPINRSQKLPGGWGVTMDDLLAAVYVNACMLVLFAIGVF